MMNNQIFLQRLKEKIDESGLTFDEIAEQAEISVQSLKRIFTMDKLPKISFLLKLHKVLHFEFDYLLQLNEYAL